jgi:hypothetical protein
MVARAIRVTGGVLGALTAAVLLAPTPADAAVTDTRYCLIGGPDNGDRYCYETGSNPGHTRVARLYQHPNYNQDADGWVLNIYKRGGCTATYSDNEGYGDLVRDMNNRVSSVRTEASCDVKLCDGSYSPCSTASVWIDQHARLSTLGNGWDNRASGFRIS